MGVSFWKALVGLWMFLRLPNTLFCGIEQLVQLRSHKQKLTLKRWNHAWKGAKMNKRILVIVLIAALAVSLFLNVALYYQNYSVNQQQKDFTVYYNEFGNVSLQSISYNFSPPVSIYRALKIALDSDDWNTTSLENMTVRVSLDYFKFTNDSTIIKNPYDNTT